MWSQKGRMSANVLHCCGDRDACARSLRLSATVKTDPGLSYLPARIRPSIHIKPKCIYMHRIYTRENAGIPYVMMVEGYHVKVHASQYISAHVHTQMHIGLRGNNICISMHRQVRYLKMTAALTS
jgi:hypothetical protein